MGWSAPYATQAVRITRTCTTVGARITRETACLVVSLPATGAQPVDSSDWARRAWHIEKSSLLGP
jgi:hypothetical protein